MLKGLALPQAPNAHLSLNFQSDHTSGAKVQPLDFKALQHCPHQATSESSVISEPAAWASSTSPPLYLQPGSGCLGGADIFHRLPGDMVHISDWELQLWTRRRSVEAGTPSSQLPCLCMWSGGSSQTMTVLTPCTTTLLLASLEVKSSSRLHVFFPPLKN